MSNREEIVKNIVSTLAAATVAGGYNNTLSGRVGRKLKHWEECGDFPQLFVVAGAERKEYGNNIMVECALDIVIRAYEHDGEDPGEKLNNLLADVEKALCVDHTRGGYAVNTTPVSVETDEGWLTPHGVAEFRWEIFYRYQYGAP